MSNVASWLNVPACGRQARLGNVDLCFLLSYAIGMFFAGHMGDRMDLRVFLSMGAAAWSLKGCLLRGCALARTLGH